MKYILLVLAFITASVFAEASFEQMQTLIEQKQYAAAEQGLELVLKNHPNSAKALYSMAQAQAGLGHLDKAKLALDKARGIDPTLSFASKGNVEALQVAITPQTDKIEIVKQTSVWPYVFLVTLILTIVCGVLYVFYGKKDKPENTLQGGPGDPTPPVDTPPTLTEFAPVEDPVIEKPKRGRKKKVETEHISSSTHVTSYSTSRYVPSTPNHVSTQSHQPTVINNYTDSNSTNMLTGVMIGSLLNSNHHDHTTVVEREVTVERPIRETTQYTAPDPIYEAPTQSSSWDDTLSTTSSSSWDNDSSTKSGPSSSSSSSDSSSSWSSSDSSSSSSSSSSSDW